LTTPSSDWNSHWNTVVAAIIGVAQVSTRPPSTSSRIHRSNRTTSSATNVDSTMISATLSAVNTAVRRTTDQNSASASTLA
jgi:hypothetical protein